MSLPPEVTDLAHETQVTSAFPVTSGRSDIRLPVVSQALTAAPPESVLRSARAAALRSDLETQTGLRIALTITDNTSTVMSVKHDRSSGLVRLRLHHMFLSAGKPVLRALSQWLLHPRSKKSGGVIDEFIRQNQEQLRARQNKTISLIHRGTFFNLRTLFDDVNRDCFGNAVDAGITWGRMPTVSRRRSIRFGSYYERENLIRIHPLLDQEFVPAYFVRYIVFHEMLHAAMKILNPHQDGRRRVHCATFRRYEKAYPDYAKAVDWEKANLKRLLRGKRFW